MGNAHCAIQSESGNTFVCTAHFAMHSQSESVCCSSVMRCTTGRRSVHYEGWISLCAMHTVQYTVKVETLSFALCSVKCTVKVKVFAARTEDECMPCDWWQ